MNIEKEIFKRSNVNFDKLIKYGFKKNNNIYIYEKEFLNDFKAIITINNECVVSGKIIDLLMNEEYITFRSEVEGEFVGKVRNAYKDILISIRDNCFDSSYFIFDQTNRVNKYIVDKYNSQPEFLWDNSPGCAIYRNKKNNKWYGLIMNIDMSKLEDSSGEVEVINIKLDRNKIQELLSKKGFYKAYHMNKNDWITIILNDTLKDKELFNLIDESYNIVNNPETWIIPANPKYYDVINAFNDTDTIRWKQSSDINAGDIVYLYVAEPYSKLMFKCQAVEVNIPYNYKDKNITINRAMKIKLLERLDNKNYTFDYLKSIGVKAIRGPRKINKEIIKKIQI